MLKSKIRNPPVCACLPRKAAAPAEKALRLPYGSMGSALPHLGETPTFSEPTACKNVCNHVQEGYGAQEV